MTIAIKVVSLAAVVVLLHGGTAEAVTLKGPGAQSCGKWTQIRKATTSPDLTPRFDAESWVFGFLSGMAIANDQDVMLTAEAEAVWSWLDNYCRANPLDSIGDGSVSLYYELVKRQRK